MHFLDKHIARDPCGTVPHCSNNRQHIIIVFNRHPDTRKSPLRYFLLNGKLSLLRCRFPVMSARLLIHDSCKLFSLLKAPTIQLLSLFVIMANPVIPVLYVLDLKPILRYFLFKAQWVVIIHHFGVLLGLRRLNYHISTIPKIIPSILPELSITVLVLLIFR
jgi:hypothetical protein